MSFLGNPYTLKNLTLRNRIVMSPMCQYSVESEDGSPGDWHFVHYTSRAIGGTGLIIIEATDVDPDGRITSRDLGLWSDDHVAPFRRLIDELHKYGAKAAIQIGHAGRKAQNANPPVAPSPIAFDDSYMTPRELTNAEVWKLIDQFADSARRAVSAGVDTIEIHGAHGYLIHQFMSPNANKRTDEFGQDLSKFGVEVIKAVKQVIPADMPLLMRISAIEYAPGGYDIDHSIEMCRKFRDAGVDLFDVSSGGDGVGGRPLVPFPGYQVPLARAIKEALDVPVIAVGLIDEPRLAESVLGNGHADLIAVGRGMLRNPYWAIDALRALDGKAEVLKQYERGY